VRASRRRTANYRQVRRAGAVLELSTSMARGVQVALYSRQVAAGDWSRCGVLPRWRIRRWTFDARAGVSRPIMRHGLEDTPQRRALDPSVCLRLRVFCPASPRIPVVWRPVRSSRLSSSGRALNAPTPPLPRLPPPTHTPCDYGSRGPAATTESDTCCSPTSTFPPGLAIAWVLLLHSTHRLYTGDFSSINILSFSSTNDYPSVDTLHSSFCVTFFVFVYRRKRRETHATRSYRIDDDANRPPLKCHPSPGPPIPQSPSREPDSNIDAQSDASTHLHACAD
jgi:hypothetical protein